MMAVPHGLSMLRLRPPPNKLGLLKPGQGERAEARAQEEWGREAAWAAAVQGHSVHQKGKFVHRREIDATRSRMGHSRLFWPYPTMSALPLIATNKASRFHSRFVPQAETSAAYGSSAYGVAFIEGPHERLQLASYAINPKSRAPGAHFIMQ
jgi:hypothetical protein